MRVDSVIAQKNKANPRFHQQPVELYMKMGGSLAEIFLNQAVDYVGWTIYRKWESGDMRSYEIIQKNQIVKSEFHLFEKGTVEYYSYKKQ